MNGEVYLDHIGFALGGRRQTVEDAGRAGRLVSDPAALRGAGVAMHHVCPPAETAYDLACAAARAAGPGLDQVDAIVYATCLPQNGNVGRAEAFTRTGDAKHLMEFPACHLQADLELDAALVIERW
jgi:3-oxoacyl-[acyl-carrier-protein] synthase III